MKKRILEDLQILIIDLINRPAQAVKLPRTAAGMIAAFGLIGILLLAIGNTNYPDLHTILDTGMCLLSGVLALLLWDMGVQVDRPFYRLIAIAFAVTSALEFVHVMVTVEWAGPLAPIAQSACVLRPSTWPPAAYILPVGVASAMWLTRRGLNSQFVYALVLVVVAAGLLQGFRWLPAYVPPGVLGITRPALAVVPILWAIIGWMCWRLRATDRLFAPLAVMAGVLLVAHLSMIYSQAPHDSHAMVAHLGKVGAYLALLLALMQIASSDMLERIRAEERLARANEDLEHRVRERTAALEAANQKAQAQLERLNLLHQITRAIGERQDLDSIFQVVVRSLEDQLPVEFTCLCLFDQVDQTLTVARVGVKSEALALELAMPERARVGIDENGLSRCVRGELVYEGDISAIAFPFPKRLARGGLRSLVVAPLQVESQVFGVLIVARVRVQGFNSGECEFLRQLSEHVALAAHQAQLYGALQQAYDDLRQTQQAVMQQERLRALGQMASGIAHDINNALSPAALYTQSLLETEQNLSPRAREYLETTQRAVEDVAHTVARMRDFSRQREPQLTLAPVELNQLVQQVVDLTRARWSDMQLQRGTVVDVRTDLAADAPAVMGVESEIREALTNLVLNAVDAVPNGGTVTLRTRALKPAVASEPGQVEVAVTDNGAGMDEETRRRCLEPFFTTKGERGTGLGLAMVYGVAQRHGAEIDITSAVGEGTSVRMIFAAAGPGDRSVAPSKSVQALPTRLRLLLVDDDPLLLQSLRAILETDGHVVTIANDGKAGIAAFRSAKERGEPFAAVVTDLGMPHIDGRRVAAAVKEMSPLTPVILLTGWGQRLISEEDTPPHVDQVLSKPPKLSEIRAALAQCCGSARVDGSIVAQAITP